MWSQRAVVEKMKACVLIKSFASFIRHNTVRSQSGETLRLLSFKNTSLHEGKSVRIYEFSVKVIWILWLDEAPSSL